MDEAIKGIKDVYVNKVEDEECREWLNLVAENSDGLFDETRQSVIKVLSKYEGFESYLNKLNDPETVELLKAFHIEGMLSIAASLINKLV